MAKSLGDNYLETRSRGREKPFVYNFISFSNQGGKTEYEVVSSPESKMTIEIGPAVAELLEAAGLGPFIAEVPRIASIYSEQNSQEVLPSTAYWQAQIVLRMDLSQDKGRAVHVSEHLAKLIGENGFVITEVLD
jgi:hypothetical protein